MTIQLATFALSLAFVCQNGASVCRPYCRIKIASPFFMTHLVEIACLTCIEVSGLPGWSCLLFLLPIDAGGAFETIRDRFIKTKNGKPGIDVIAATGNYLGLAH
jgi:hypothetical protein